MLQVLHFVCVCVCVCVCGELAYDSGLTCHLQPFVSAYSALCKVKNAALNLAENVKVKLHFYFKSYCCVTQAQI